MPNEEVTNRRTSQSRRLKQAKMQRQIRRSERRLKRLRSLYKNVLVLVLIFLAFYILKLPQWRLHSDAFDSLESKQLEIVNNRIVPSQKILSAIRRNQVPKRPIFLVKTDNIKKSILQLEPIQDVYIRRFWFPARLQVIVIERSPIITIAPNPEVSPIAFFSSDGKLIGREYMPLANDYKTFLVLTYGTGDDYRNWDVVKVNNFKKLAMLVERETGEAVEYIDYRDPSDVYIKIPTVNIRLGSVNSSTFEKIQRLPSLLPQVKLVNKRLKYIDLRWDSNYFKLDE